MIVGVILMWSQVSRLGNQRVRAIERETGEEPVVCQMTTLMWNAWTLFESDTCILWIVNKLAKAAPRRSRVFSWCWLSKRWENFHLSTCLTFPLLPFCQHDATKKAHEILDRHIEVVFPRSTSFKLGFLPLYSFYFGRLKSKPSGLTWLFHFE